MFLERIHVRHRLVIIAVAAVTLSLTACSDVEPGGAELNGKGTNQSNPADVPLSYLRLPDGRVLECVVSMTSHGYPATDCNWDQPVNAPAPQPAPSPTL